MRQRTAQTLVTATDISSILKASRKLSCLHGMQGVRSSSLLGSIQEKPSPLVGFFYDQCAAMIPLDALCLCKKMKRCKLWAPTWTKEVGWAPEAG